VWTADRQTDVGYYRNTVRSMRKRRAVKTHYSTSVWESM